MDGRDGWHVASFQSASNKTIINPVMLRFRPIAPKPAAGGSFPGGISPENTSAVVRTSKRVKRKYVRVRNKDNNSSNPRRRSRNNNNNNNSTRSSAVEERESGFNSTTVTLQLMPEKSDGCDFLGSCCNSSTGSLCIIDPYRTAIQDNYYYNNNSYNNRHPPGGEALDRAAVTVTAADEVVESWVTVESVTDTCMDDARGLGCTDVERIKNLQRDTCPGFVSDGCFTKVEWVNEAYKRMVAEVVEEGRRRWPEVVVWLVANNNNNRINYNNKAIKAELGLMGPAFTCRVRLQYMKVNKEKCSRIMPCDVWKMDTGGFAWRLDIKAALSLGL